MKTYILAPNFQYKPSGPIQIGNIIADPFYPAKPLSIPAEGESPAIESVLEHSHELVREKGHSVSVGFWATFLQSIGANINVARGTDMVEEYSITELETRYVRDEPLDDDVHLARRLREPRVQTAINAGLFGRRPVYLITGIKIARGLSLRTQLSRRVGSGIGSTLPVTEGISAGAEVSSERRDGTSSSFTAGEEAIVFAYQLHKICPRGAKRNATIGVYRLPAAFLHDDDEETADVGGQQVSIDLATAETLLEDEDDDMEFEKIELIDDGSRTRYHCLFLKEA